MDGFLIVLLKDYHFFKRKVTRNVDTFPNFDDLHKMDFSLILTVTDLYKIREKMICNNNNVCIIIMQ